MSLLHQNKTSLNIMSPHPPLRLNKYYGCVAASQGASPLQIHLT